MMILQNPQRQQPHISDTAWISETAVIVGNVTIEDVEGIEDITSDFIHGVQN